MSRYAIVEILTGLVTNIVLWDGDLENWQPPEGSQAYALSDESPVGIGWSYVDGTFVAPPEPEVPPPTDAEIIAINTAKLQQSNQLAAAQKTALTNRVATLQDAIDLEMATPAELVEMPIRQAQLLEWKKYAIYLGRVTQQSGWALTVDWPVEPEQGMDLTVSAVSAAKASTS